MVDCSSHIKPEDVAKRIFDIVAAALGLILLTPLFVILRVLIKRDSAGPVIYQGWRVGRGGRPFRILKFRTMYENGASYAGPRLTSSEDERVTPLGRWLRDTKINELPQLWNILRGDMSLVGPRPEDPEIIKAYPAEQQDELLSIRPGITSPASVLYHSEQDLLRNDDLMGTYLKEILPDKLRLDLLYVRNRSFISDIDIVFWTLAIFIPRLAKTKIPEGHLFAGPLSRFVYRHFSWFLVDIAVVFAASSITTLAWRTHGPLDWGWNSLLLLSLAFAFIFSTVNFTLGLNRIYWSKARWDDAFGLVFSAGGVTSAALFLNYLQDTYLWFPFPALPPVMIISVGLLATFGFVSARYRLRLLTMLAESWLVAKRNAHGTGERILILGEGEACNIATWLLEHGVFRHAFSIVGIVASEDPTKQGMRINGSYVLGGIQDLPALVKQYDARMILYTLSSPGAGVRDMVFATSKASGIKLIFLEDLLKYVSRNADKPDEVREYLDWLQKRADSSMLHDALTGLPNSNLLEERLRQSIAYSKRYNTKPALLLIELNGSINRGGLDRRNMEDDLLKMAAKRLMSIKRESDMLARFRSHEFALLLENVPNDSAAETILARTKALISEPIAIGDNTVSVQANITLCFPVGNLEDLKKRLHLSSADEESEAKPLAYKATGTNGAAHLARGIPNRRSVDPK